MRPSVLNLKLRDSQTPISFRPCIFGLLLLLEDKQDKAKNQAKVSFMRWIYK